MPVTRINNNQITDSSAGNLYLGINAAAKLQDYSITSTKIANSLTYGSDLTIAGNLTVQGNTTTIDTVNVVVEDPLILLAAAQTGSPTLDIGFIGKRGTEDNIAFVWDEANNVFVTAFTTSEVTNTTIAINSYASFKTFDAAVAGNLAVTGTSEFTGNITINNLFVDGASTLDMGNSIISNVAEPVANNDVATKAYVDSQSASGFTIEDDTANTTIVSGGDTLQLLGTTNEVTVAITAADQITFGLPTDVTVTGNLSANNVSATNNVDAITVTATGNLNGNNAVITNDVGAQTVTATGNVSANNVSATNNVDAVTVTATGNLNGNNASITNDISATTGSFSGNVSSNNLSATNNVDAATVTATGNLNGNNAVITNNVGASTVTATGNINGGNVISSALVEGVTVTATGNLNGNNAVITNDLSATTGSFSGNVSSNNLSATNGITAGTTIVATGNVSGGNLVTAGDVTTATVTATGNITGGNIATAGTFTASSLSATGNITGGNLNTAGQVVATGDITGGNLITGGFVSATGNVSGGNVISSALVQGVTVTATGNLNGNNAVIANDLSTTTVSATGNINGGNVISSALVQGLTVTATGNLNGNNAVITNDVSATTGTFSGNIAGANLNAVSGVYSTTVDATGNVTGGNLNTVGLVSAGNIAATGNINGGNLISTALVQGATLTATGNVNANNVIATSEVFGALLTSSGNVDSQNINVALTAFVGNVEASGNVDAGIAVNTNDIVGTGLTLTSTGDLFLSPTGNINADNNRIIQVGAPTQAADAATKQYVDDAVSTGITIHTPVYVETATALPAATYAQGGTTATVTDTIAGNTVVFSSAINPQVNDQLWFTNSFQGIIGNIPYFVVSAPNTSAAILSTTYDGLPVANITSASGLTQAVRINSGQGATLTGNVNAQLTVDGVALTGGERVLVYQQTPAYENGVYDVTVAGDAGNAWVLTRSSDMDTYIPNDINGLDAGDYVFVQAGLTGAGESYVLTAPVGPVIIGYNSLTFTQFSASSTYSANTAAGLVLNGTVFSAKVDNVSTAFDGGGNIVVPAGATLVDPFIGNALANSLSVAGNGLITATNIELTGNVLAGNVNSNALVTAASATVTGNILAGNLNSNSAVTGVTGTFSGNIDGANLGISGVAVVSGNITGANLNTAGTVSTATVTATGNVSAGNLVTLGTVDTATLTATGNIVGGNLNTLGNASANYFIGNGSQLTGVTASSVNAADLTGNTLSANVLFSSLTSVGNLTTLTVDNTATVGNLSTGGYVTATGNVTGGNIVTTGDVTTSTVTASGNVFGGNLTTSGDVTTATVTASGNIGGANLNVTGVYSTTVNSTGNVTGGNLVTAGDVTTATVTATGNVNGGNIVTTGDVTTATVTATGNITGGNLISSGAVIGNIQVTGNISVDNILASGNILAANLNSNGAVTGSTADFIGNVLVGNLSTSGQVAAGLLLSTGNIEATTGNVTANNVIGLNLVQGVTVTATGNLNGNNASITNILTAGSGDFAGNVDVDNLNAGNSVNTDILVATGNITGANLVTAGVVDAASVVASGNINGANLVASAGVVATGNVTGGNIVTAGTVTGATVTATGNVNANNVIATTSGRFGNIVISGDNITDDGGNIVTINGAAQNIDFSVGTSGEANTFFISGSLGTASFGSEVQTTGALVSFNSTDSVLLPVGNTTVRPGTPVEGMFRYNTTEGTVEWYDGVEWQQATSDFTVIVNDQFNGDGSTTTFTLSQNSTTAGTIVTINGVVQIPTTAYAVTGNSLQFTEAPEVSDVIDARILTTSSTVSGISGAGGASFTAGSGLEFLSTGSLVPTANVTYDLGNATSYWRDLYLSGTSIRLGNIWLKNTNGSLQVFQADGTSPAPSGTTSLINGTSNVVTAASGNVTVGVAGTSVGTFTSSGLVINGSIQASSFIGIDAAKISNGTSEMSVISSGGNIRANIGGSTVQVLSSGGADITGYVAATGNVTGTNITGTNSVVGGGITLNANTISSAGTTLTLDPSAPGATGLVVIAGNLQVNGTTTTIDSTTITINDLVFTVANNAATASAANGGGIEVGPVGSPYATWLYDQPNSRWSTALGINATGNITAGNVSGTNVTGTLLTAAQPNITSIGTLSSLAVSGNVTAGNLSVSTGTVTLGGIVNANANGVGNIGSSTGYFNTVFAKATSAQYADLAEMYEADQIIEPGTVVCFGGAKEVTVCTEDGSKRIAGVVSTNPSYIMNAGLQGDNVVAVALTGRVPVKVTGTIRKGDMIVATGDGRGRAEANPAVGQVIGKALADFDGTDGVIEVVVGRL